MTRPDNIFFQYKACLKEINLSIKEICWKKFVGVAFQKFCGQKMIERSSRETEKNSVFVTKSFIQSDENGFLHDVGFWYAKRLEMENLIAICLTREETYKQLGSTISSNFKIL